MNGRTNNPYDLRRIPGGSSGGEGALVGAGASLFGLGNDLGGSVRIPAFMCGVFGLKPTKRVFLIIYIRIVFIFRRCPAGWV